jgi:predicted short-subunit dehydrogenase-like oxidoreductase (DUF2520 family)
VVDLLDADFAIAAILRYAARVRRTGARSNGMTAKRKPGGLPANKKPAVAIVGSGSLASFLAPALRAAGYKITEIIARAGSRPESIRRARALAREVGAKDVSAERAALDAAVVWFLVPDRQIRPAAKAVAERLAALRASGGASGSAGSIGSRELRFAFHSSGALLSDELVSLRRAGVAVASVHPLMTFVAGARPSLAHVPFAVEGDAVATRLARRMVRDLGAESFILPAGRKAAYHAWATMTSPLLVAYLVTLEEAARRAGLSREGARQMSQPIILQTLANYGRRGPANSFSGPFVRGDAETVAKHLALLRTDPFTHSVYLALARVAVGKLPVKNRRELRRLLDEDMQEPS